MAQATSILTGEIMAQAAAFKQATTLFNRQFFAFSNSVPPLAPEHFWPMVEQFRTVLLDTMTYRKEGFVEAAANEFLRLAAVKGGDIAPAVHFALSWRHYVRKAYAAGDEAGFSFERGDDGYGDLMDAVPLLGQEFNRKLETGWFGNLREFNEKVDATCDVAGRVLKDVVLHGENYFASSLEEAAQKWIVLESRNYGKDGE